jgi:hypothetical protein
MDAQEFDYIINGFFREADSKMTGILTKADRKMFIGQLMIVSGKS